MALLHILSYVGGLALFLFVTLSLASGLLWLAELIEEHSKYAKTIGMRAIYVVIALHVVLLFTDALPVLPTALGIFAHLVYLTNFSTTWPYISLTSPQFLGSCVLVISDHFAWFYHFANKANEAKRFRTPKYRYGGGYHREGPAFMDVAAFFAICVWFVPLFLFLSLSANDNALPSFDASLPATPSAVDLTTPLSRPMLPGQSRIGHSTSLVKSALTPILSLLPRLRSRGRKNEEGIIAPRTPVRGSPLHSPVNLPQTSYFPRSNDGQVSGNSSTGPNLSVDMRNRARTPPPPRRVQSDAQVQHALNPRGVATRGGVPAFESDEEKIARTSSPQLVEDTGLKMSLGGQGKVVGEIVDSHGPSKRKSD